VQDDSHWTRVPKGSIRNAGVSDIGTRAKEAFTTLKTNQPKRRIKDDEL